MMFPKREPVGDIDSPASSKLLRRMEQRGVRQGGDGCWEWLGAKAGAGYGYVTVYEPRKRNQYVHRIAYELWIGPIEDGYQVLHRCDNPACFNPDHLFMGARSDNMQDMHAKGREPEQMRHHPGRSLSNEDIAWVRQSSCSTREAARVLGVHHSSIGKIRARETYADVD